jgi:hypothetical protein
MRPFGELGCQSQNSHAILDVTLRTNRAVCRVQQGRLLSVVRSAHAHPALRVRARLAGIYSSVKLHVEARSFF